MKLKFNSIRIFLFASGLIVFCSGCSLVALPFNVAEDALEGTGTIVAEVGEAL